jgi:hypothetical protein
MTRWPGLVALVFRLEILVSDIHESIGTFQLFIGVFAQNICAKALHSILCSNIFGALRAFFG